MRTAQAISVLLVDDDELQQARVSRASVMAGLKQPMLIASDGAEALELLRSGQLPARCVVLLDVHMPRMNGLEFLRALRADPALRHQVVVMLSTSQEADDLRQALAMNVAGFILKSIDFQRCVDQLRVLNEYWSMMEVP